MTLKPGRLPTLHVRGDSIPQAYYRALKAVWFDGASMPTQYDRRNEAGELIDPPGKDARVLIEVRDPFAQPRYPAITQCEIGTYIAEIMGAKDHRTVPISVLNKMVAGQELVGDEKAFQNHWPYTYHERLFAHSETDGNRVNQVDLAIDSVAQTPFTRRAVCSTAVPNLDPFLPKDIPCLRELQLRCLEDDKGELVLNASTTWRSRDLLKAWGDNVIGLTFLLARIAEQISLKCGRPVKVGSYADYSMSLHIYGQDVWRFKSNEAAGFTGFFETFPNEEEFIRRSTTSDQAAYMFVLDQLNGLLAPDQIKQWDFPESSLELIQDLIDGISSGRYIC